MWVAILLDVSINLRLYFVKKHVLYLHGKNFTSNETAVNFIRKWSQDSGILNPG
jgi:hypothetical protein